MPTEDELKEHEDFRRMMERSGAQQADPNFKLAMAVVILMITIPVYYMLRVNEYDGLGLMALVGPLVTYLVIGARLDRDQDRTERYLTRIDYHTNGVLESKIAKGAAQAIKSLLPEMLEQHDRTHHPEIFNRRPRWRR